MQVSSTYHLCHDLLESLIFLLPLVFFHQLISFDLDWRSAKAIATRKPQFSIRRTVGELHSKSSYNQSQRILRKKCITQGKLSTCDELLTALDRFLRGELGTRLSFHKICLFESQIVRQLVKFKNVLNNVAHDTGLEIH